MAMGEWDMPDLVSNIDHGFSLITFISFPGQWLDVASYWLQSQWDIVCLGTTMNKADISNIAFIIIVKYYVLCITFCAVLLYN